MIILLVGVGGEKDEMFMRLAKIVTKHKKSAAEVISGYFALTLTNFFELP